MSSADLLDDSFPHGTKAGYEQGCRSGGACAGKENGQTCKQAATRYRSDRTYKRLVDDGASIEEQAMPEGGALPVAASKPKPVNSSSGRLRGMQPTTAPDPLHTVPAVVEPTPTPVPPAPKTMGPSPVPIADRLVGKHGTPTGYSYGCRDDCPGGPDGVTCRKANSAAYRRRREAARAANAGAATSPDETSEPVNGTEPAVIETPGTENVPDQTETGPEETTALAEVVSQFTIGDWVMVKSRRDAATPDEPAQVTAIDPHPFGAENICLEWPGSPGKSWYLTEELEPATPRLFGPVAPERTPELEQTLAELREKHPPLSDDQWPGNNGPVSTDPTHGRIDRDIQLAVDEMNPVSVGQRVAIENTFQDRRNRETPALAAEETSHADTTTPAVSDERSGSDHAEEPASTPAVSAGVGEESPVHSEGGTDRVPADPPAGAETSPVQPSSPDSSSQREGAADDPDRLTVASDPVDASKLRVGDRVTAVITIGDRTQLHDRVVSTTPVQHDDGSWIYDTTMPELGWLLPTRDALWNQPTEEDSTTNPWTGQHPTNPHQETRRSPQPSTPFDRDHRHTVLQHLVFPLLRALWLEALESREAE